MKCIRWRFVLWLGVFITASWFQLHAQGKDTLSLQIADVSISENGGSTSGTVQRSGAITQDLAVSLSVDLPGVVQFPANITIGLGQDTSAPFTITALDDNLLTGTRSLNFTATAAGNDPGADGLDILDFETLSLTPGATSLFEGETTTLNIKRENSNIDLPLKVFLQIEDATELSTIPDAQIADKADSVNVQVQALNDQIADGTQNSRIFATATGYQPAEISIETKDLIYDFGDAPDPFNAQAGTYPTRLSSDGARHLPQGPMLGVSRDGELDAIVSGDATGDDGNNTDDEDGLILPQFSTGQEETIQITVSHANGQLDAWIDWNQDGVWDSPTEKIVDNLFLTVGQHQFKTTVPATAGLGKTYARFRISTAGNLSPSSLANDGEVEDYQVIVVSGVTPPTVELTTRGNLPMTLGQSFTVESQSTGTAPLQFQWLKDGQPIQGQTSSTLTLSSVQATDAGAYQLQASNPAGTAISGILNVGILGLIKLNGEIGEQTLIQGDLAVFEYTFIGPETFQFQWTKDNTSIPFQTGNPFVIQSVGREDAGTYHVIALGTITHINNQTGEAASLSLPLPLQILSPPDIALSPYAGNLVLPATQFPPGAFELSALLFNVTNPINFQWFKNGSPLEGEQGSSLSFNPHDPQNWGEYHVEVSNPGGVSASRSLRIAELQRPIINGTSGESVLVDPGKPAILSTTVLFPEHLEFQWYFGDTPIEGADQPTFTIPNVSHDHIGAYRVLVSMEALSHVGPGPDDYTPLSGSPDGLLKSSSPPVNLILSRGISLMGDWITHETGFLATVNAILLREGDTPELQWFKDDVAIPGQNGTRLTFPFYQRENAGSYFVRMTDEDGVYDSPLLNIGVIGSTILNGTPSQFLFENPQMPIGLPTAQSALLEIEQFLPDSMQVQWDWHHVRDLFTLTSVLDPFSRQNNGLQGARIGEISDSLEIPSTSLAHSGFFFISARTDGLIFRPADGTYSPLSEEESNLLAAISWPIHIEVQDPPVIALTPIAGDYVWTNTPSTPITPDGFQIQARHLSGTEPITYQWFKNGSPLEDGQGSLFIQGSLLSLSPLDPQNWGVYHVEASNFAGVSVSRSLRFAELQPPIVNGMSGESVLVDPGKPAILSTTLPFPEHFEFQWYIGDTAIEGADQPTYTIPNVSHEHLGPYRVLVSIGAFSYTGPGPDDYVPLSASPDELLKIPSPPVSLKLSRGISLAGDLITYETGFLATVNAILLREGDTPELQWFKDDVAIPGQNGTRLTFPFYHPENAGSYFVRMTDEDGVYDSPLLNIGVIGSTILNGTPSQFLFENPQMAIGLPTAQSALLEIEQYLPNSMQVQWQWHHVPDLFSLANVFDPFARQDNGLPRVRIGEISDSLEIPSTSRMDSGYYFISAKTDVLIFHPVDGTYTPLSEEQSNVVAAISWPVHIAVQDPPEIGLLPFVGNLALTDTQLTLFPFDAFELSTHLFSGTDPVNIQWFKNGSPIENANIDRLTLNLYDSENWGEYHVEASNFAGVSVSRSLRIAELQRPIVNGMSGESVLVDPGKPVILSTAIPFPEHLEFQWYFGDTPIEGATGSEYTLPNVTHDQAGLYNVHVFMEVFVFDFDQEAHYRPANGEGNGLQQFETPNVELIVTPYDFGDAPSKFPGTETPTQYAIFLHDGGAHHTSSGPMLGRNRDGETDGQPDSQAMGDDHHSPNATDDEDGIQLPNFRPGEEALIMVSVKESPGKLDAWVDWNADGDWADAGEKIFDSVSFDIGTHPLTIQVPDNLNSGITFARFRLSSEGQLDTGGFAPDGEVEDYLVNISITGNQPPLARSDRVDAVSNKSLEIPLALLLSNDSDPDGDNLSFFEFTSGTQRGGVVSRSGNQLNYVSRDAFVGPDSFEYTITDPSGATATAEVLVRVSGTEEAALENGRVVMSSNQVNDSVDFLFAGLPNQTYLVQISEDLVTWTTVATITSGSDGVIRYLDQNAALLEKRFYRVVTAM